MILYNVTINIDASVENEWKTWMINTHIPDVLKTNCFIEAKLSRIHGEEDGGATYSIMYTAKTQDDINLYQNSYSSRLQQEHTQKFQGKFAAFRTLLTVVEEFKV
jgi:hypothetical protein